MLASAVLGLNRHGVCVQLFLECLKRGSCQFGEYELEVAMLASAALGLNRHGVCIQLFLECLKRGSCQFTVDFC
jgi:hypothetical protein